MLIEYIYNVLFIILQTIYVLYIFQQNVFSYLNYNKTYYANLFKYFNDDYTLYSFISANMHKYA